MSLNATTVNTYADLGDRWLRHQTARLHQKHLQFGQHCRLDVDALLARAAGVSRTARPAETPTVREHMSTDHIRRAMLEAIEHCAQLKRIPLLASQRCSPAERRMQSASAPKRRCMPGPATLGEFVLTNRLAACPRDEWMAVLADSTEVVVPDVQGAPSSLALEKAVSIVQSRAYLEKRALQLLVPFTKDRGDWRLVTLDFGVEAQRHECEFLMCFAFQVGSGELSITSPYVEIGFSLPVPTDEDPVFVLTVRTAVGFPN